MTFDELMATADDLRFDFPSVANETVFAEEDKAIVESFLNSPANWVPVGEEIAAINTMAYNYGIQIKKKDGSDNYVLSGRDGAYEITEDEIQGLLNTVQTGIVEKLMYLEKDKLLEAFKSVYDETED